MEDSEYMRLEQILLKALFLGVFFLVFFPVVLLLIFIPLCVF